MLVMAYDYHWSTSGPGAVAPMDKLRATADYTVAHVPAKKVIWGVGVYGYDWKRYGVTLPITSKTASATPTMTPTSTPTLTKTPTGAISTPAGTSTSTPTATPTGKAEYRNYAEAMAAPPTDDAQSG